MKIITNTGTDRVIDLIRSHLMRGNQLDVVTPSFSLFAFAEMLEETMSAQMEGMRQPVKQAGFYVLVGASMPNVLVESGYLSNVKDERFLRSPAGQKKIATAILNSLKGYKNEYENENR